MFILQLLIQGNLLCSSKWLKTMPLKLVTCAHGAMRISAPFPDVLLLNSNGISSEETSTSFFNKNKTKNVLLFFIVNHFCEFKYLCFCNDPLFLFTCKINSP